MKKLLSYILIFLWVLLIISTVLVLPPYTTGFQVLFFVKLLYPLLAKFGYLGYIISWWIFFLSGCVLVLIGKYILSQYNKQEGVVPVNFFKIFLISTIIAGIIFFLPNFIIKKYSQATQSNCTKYNSWSDKRRCYINYEPETYQKLMNECSPLLWVSEEDIKKWIQSGYGNSVESCRFNLLNIEFRNSGYKKWDMDCSNILDEYVKRDCESNSKIVQARTENDPKLCPTQDNVNMECLSNFVDTKEWKNTCENIDQNWSVWHYRNFIGNCLNKRSLNKIYQNFINSDIKEIFYPNLNDELENYSMPIWFSIVPYLVKSHLNNSSLDINTTDSVWRTILIDYLQLRIIWWNKSFHDTEAMRKIQTERKLMSAWIWLNTDCSSCIQNEIDEAKKNIEILVDLGVNPNKQDILWKNAYDYIQMIEVPGMAEKIKKILP